MPDGFTQGDPSERFVGPRWFDELARWTAAHVRGLLLVGVAFQLLVLASMIVVYAAPLVFGERILLRVVPVDPRDVFRGDYVVLSYDFSRVPAAGISGVPAPPRWRSAYYSSESWLEDRPVYVSLKPDPDGRHYVMDQISLARPGSGKYLKGKYARSWNGADLHFGIEAFYVEEGKGMALERRRNVGQLSAEIALTSWGQAALCGLK